MEKHFWSEFEPPSCTRCDQCDVELEQQQIQFAQCKHNYCSKCVSAFVRQQLSLFNKIPTCISPECDQPLNMEHISRYKSMIGNKYLINPSFDLSNTKHLLTGFIRNIHSAISDDIILLISDFHHLDIVKTVPCTNCKYTSIYCFQCDGKKCLTVLDLHKLCKKQIQCMQCNEYYPMDSITFWSNCQHTICVRCFLTFVDRQITTNKRIPLCPEEDCNEELGEHNAFFMSDVWRHMRSFYDIPHTMNTEQLTNILETLFYRKNKFKCAYCNLWHDDHVLCVDKSVDCEHKYSAQCSEEWTASNGDTDCIKCVAKCEICEQYAVNRDLRKWGVCGHKYHIDCAQKYINEWIPLHANKSILDVFRRTECLIPLCIHKDCDQLLGVRHELHFGLSYHQSSVLYDLRRYEPMH